MAEKIVDEMAVHLEQGHLEHLSNVLYVNFHGLEVQEQCTELDRKSTRLNSSHVK